MPEIAVTFMHPIDDNKMTVDLDDELTADEVADLLVVHDFVAASPDSYQLSSMRTGSTLVRDQKLRAAGVKSGDVLRVLPSAPAGAASGTTPTPEAWRRERLRNDRTELLALAGPRLSVKEVSPGRFRLLLDLRTIVGSEPSYREKHNIEVKLAPVHPDRAPEITALDRPLPFHPNWWSSGRWCEGQGTWTPLTSLAQHVIRMIRSLRFDAEVTNPNSPANEAAAAWYVSHRGSDLFPTDHGPLPGVQSAPPAAGARFRPRPGLGRRAAR